jgi:hypothetical protein
MKDSEFFELLNLYVDHEISAADAARLESEVQGNLERRRVYRQYCRMQKACTLLARDFVGESVEQKVLAFEPRRSAWGPGGLAIGGLAVAAACVAFVFVNRRHEAAPGATAPAAQLAVVQPVAPAPAVAETKIQPVQPQNPPASAIARTVTLPVRRGDFQPVFVSTPFTFNGPNANAEALIAAAQENAQARFEWMKRMRLAPMQQMPAEELRIDARSPLQLGSRIYSSDRPGDGELPMSAFQFQK